MDMHKHWIIPIALDTLIFEPLFLLWFGYVDATVAYTDKSVSTLFTSISAKRAAREYSILSLIQNRPDWLGYFFGGDDAGFKQFGFIKSCKSCG